MDNLKCKPLRKEEQKDGRDYFQFDASETPPTQGQKKYEIMLEDGIIHKFVGVYRRDLEKPNWHYFETSDSFTGKPPTLIHYRKDKMLYVKETEV